MSKDTNNIFVICDCNSHALYLEKIDDDNIPTLYISVFERGTDGKQMRWFDRIRWIWHIIKNGHPFTDMVVIEKDKVKDIQKFLKEQFD
jgi:hypothetical protein